MTLENLHSASPFMLLSHMLCIYCLLCVMCVYKFSKKLNSYRVGRERSQEDSVESFIERCRTFFSEQRCQDIDQTPVLPFCSYKHRHAHTQILLLLNRGMCPLVLSHLSGSWTWERLEEEQWSNLKFPQCLRPGGCWECWDEWHWNKETNITGLRQEKD